MASTRLNCPVPEFREPATELPAAGHPARAGGIGRLRLLWLLGIGWLLLGCAVPPRPLPVETTAFGREQEAPQGGEHPTLADFWDGRAQFTVEVADTGLPMGESDTLILTNGEWWSFVHASHRSAEVMDGCGEPVAFPGCMVIYRSRNQGVSFHLAHPATCQIRCNQCPCDPQTDHTDQQQYPRVFYDGRLLHGVYEYRGMVMWRTSTDGLQWSSPQRVPLTGIWQAWLRPCRPEERIGAHPHLPAFYDCLAGGPPGLYIEGKRLYLFLAQGRNPGSMGCVSGEVDQMAFQWRPCRHNPLFTGAPEYGPLSDTGPGSNAYFDFRTISSADVHRVAGRYYMLYEGVRGPGPGDPGDTQFGLGLARSRTQAIDGPWERFPHNPILVDQPGNIGLGHGDLVVHQGRTYLYTSLDGLVRSRLVLVWR